MKKRLFAIILTLVMVLSMVPVQAFAADGAVEAQDQETTEVTRDTATETKAADGTTVLAFTADVHNGGGQSGRNNTAAERLATWITRVESLYNDDIDVFAFGGDMGSAYISGSNFWSYAETAMDKVSDAGITGIYTTGNHEYSNGSFSSTTNSVKDNYKVDTKAEEGSNYIIYCLGSSSDSQGYTYTTAVDNDQVEKLTDFLSKADSSKPIFIITHFPLHYLSSRRTTSNADKVIDALNNAANAGKTIIYLWGHNHTDSDGLYDTIVKPDESIQYGSSSSNSKPIKFYYAAAGCMSDDEYGSGSAFVNGKGMVARISSSNAKAAGLTVDLSYVNESGSELNGSSAKATISVKAGESTGTTINGYVLVIDGYALSVNSTDDQVSNSNGQYLYSGLDGVAYDSTTEVTTDILWDITETDGGYYIKSQDGKFLNATYTKTDGITYGVLKLDDTPDVWIPASSFETWSNGGCTIQSTNASNNTLGTSGAAKKMYMTHEESSSSSGGSAINLFTVRSNGETSKIVEASVTIGEVPVTSISIKNTSASVKAGKTLQLQLDVQPSNANNYTVAWSSSDTDIATVDESTGKVTGVSEGTTAITVTVTDSSNRAVFTDNIDVTVTESTGPDYFVIIIDNYALSRNPYDGMMSNSYGYEYHGLQAVTYDTSTPAPYEILWTLVPVDGVENGYYIKSYSGSYLSATYVQGSSSSTSGYTGTLTVGETTDIWVVSSGMDAWTGDGSYLKSTNASDNPKNNDIYLTTRTSNNSVDFFTVGSSSNYKLSRLIEPESIKEPVAVTGITVNPTEIEIEAGKTISITATVTPANADDPTFTWRSNDESIATVDASGRVKGISVGSTTITATTNDGGFTATCTVEVTPSSAPGIGYVIVIGDYALSTEPSSDVLVNSGSGSQKYNYTGLAGVEYNTNTEATENILWLIEPTDGGYYIMSQDGRYLNATYTANSTGGNDGVLKLDDTPDVWTFEGSLEDWVLSGSTLHSANANKYMTHEEGSTTAPLNLFTVRSTGESSQMIDPDSPAEERFVETSAFSTGKDYIVAVTKDGSSVYVVKNLTGTSSGNTGSATLTNANKEYYPASGSENAYIVTNDTTIIWNYTSNRYLENNGRYLSRPYSGTAVPYASGTGRAVTYDSTNKRLSVSYGGTYYLTNSNGTFGYTETSGSAAQVRLFEKQTVFNFKYVVQFVSNGVNYQSSKYASGEVPVYTGATPTRAENAQYTYTFRGWSSDGGTTTYGPDEALPAVTGPVTYVAQFTAVPKPTGHTVTFFEEDGETVIDTVTVEDNTAWDDVEKPTAPEKTGYTFSGWTGAPDTVTADVTVKASYTINTYTVTFVDEDGSTVLKEATPYDYGTAWADVVKPADPTKTGYTFAGWTNVPETITADVTVTASYTINTYTVTFNTEDGEKISDVEVDYNTAWDDVTKPTAPAKTGYTFSAWTNAPETVTADLTVTASYTANTYKVKFDKNDTAATGTMADQDFTYGVTQTLRANTFTKENWSFAGWATSASATEVEFTDGQSVSNLAAENGAVVTLYAIWTQNAQITVTFKANGGTGEDKTQTMYKNVPTVLDANTFSYTGYTFEGWATSATGDKVYNDGATVTFSEDTTLFAKWTANTFTVQDITGTFTYTGVAQTPDVVVKDGETTLTKGTDYTVEYSNNVNAGTASVTVTGIGNYVAQEAVTRDFTIGKAPLTVTANAKTITYGNAPANDGVSYNAFVNNETEDVLNGTLTYTYTYTQYGDVGEYDIMPAGLTSNNYAITFANGKLTVEAKEVGLTWSDTTFAYDGEDHAPTATATGLVNGDSVTVTVTGAASAIGTHTATASALSSANYKLPAANTTEFTITKGTQAAPTGVVATPETISGKNDGTITGLTSAMEYSTDGENWTPITEDMLTDGVLTGMAPGTYKVRYAETENYNASAAAEVKVEASTNKLTVTFDTNGGSTVAAQSVAYNGKAVRPEPDPTKAGFTFAGWYKEAACTNAYDFNAVVTDIITIYAKWSANGFVVQDITGTFTYTGVAQTPDVVVKDGETTLTKGTDYTVAYSNNVNAGTASVTVTGIGNYVAQEAVTKRFTIGKAPLTVTAKAKTITYGEAPANDGVTYATFVNDETASVLGGTLTFTYTYTQYGNVGEYDIMPAGLTSDNYAIEFAKGTLTVEAKEVGLTWSDTTFAYDGEDHAPAATATGLVNGDSVTITVTGAASAAGTHTATASALSSANYKLPGNNTAEFTIAPKSISNAVITLGEALTYTGSEQTQTIISVTADGLTVTYTVSGNTGTNAGEYTLTVTGTGNFTGTATKVFTIGKADQAAPTVDKTDETVSGKNDGTITGLTTAMEYSTDGETWTAATAATLTGLAPGTYYVRYAEDANHNASEPETVVIADSKNKLTVTWRVEGRDDVVEYYDYGATPSYTGTAPSKASTVQYNYTFAGWTPEIGAITTDTVYTATFTESTRQYAIQWLKEDGTQFDVTNVPYGTVPTHGAPPKAPTEEYTYTFAGWDPEPVAVTGEASYRATFDAVPNNFSLSGAIESFKDSQGNEGAVAVVLYAFSEDGVPAGAEAIANATVASDNKSYSFDEVPVGKYILRVSKLNHATRDYVVEIGSGSNVQNVKIHLLGDLNGDGKITAMDVSKVHSHMNNKRLLTGYEFNCADLDGNGEITAQEFGRINAHAIRRSFIW